MNENIIDDFHAQAQEAKAKLTALIEDEILADDLYYALQDVLGCVQMMQELFRKKIDNDYQEARASIDRILSAAVKGE